MTRLVLLERDTSRADRASHVHALRAGRPRRALPERPLSAIRAVVAVSCLAVAGLAAFAASASLNVEERVTYSSVSICSLLLACLAVISSNTRASAFFDLRLGPWVFAYASVAFGPATLTALTPEWASRRIPAASLPSTLAILAIAFVLCLWGYQAKTLSRLLGAPLRAVRSVLERTRTESPRPILALYGVFALGLAGDIIGAVLLRSYGYLGDSTLVTSESAAWYAQPLQILSALKLAALFGLAIVSFSRPGRLGLAPLLPALCAAIPLAVFTGLKEAFIDIVLALLLPYVISRGRVRPVPILAAAAVFVLVVTPLVTTIRADVRGDRTLGLREAAGSAVLRTSSPGDYLASAQPRDSVLQVLSRLRQVDNLAVIESRTPTDIPYRDFGEVLAAPVTGVVPRLLWPEKPVRLSGYEFYKDYYLGLGQSSSAITLQGSLYMYGGPVVLLLGMFLVGMLLRATDDALAARSSHHSALLLLFAAPIVVKQEMDVPGFLASLPILGLTWIVSTLAVFQGKRR